MSRTKRAEREQRLAHQRRYRRVRWAAAVVVVAGLVAGAVSLYRSDVFAIESVRVVGASRLSDRQVLELARVPRDATLLRFPAEGVKKRLMTNPWISSALVVRDFPDGMTIRIAERRPTALLDTGQDFWLVDREGWVLEKRSMEETVGLPVVRDVEGADPKVGRRSASEPLVNALHVLAGIGPELRANVRAVSARSIDETALLTNEGVEILVGTAVELRKKDFVARQILREQRGKVVFIDVRNLNRDPVWRGLSE